MCTIYQRNNISDLRIAVKYCTIELRQGLCWSITRMLSAASDNNEPTKCLNSLHYMPCMPKASQMVTSVFAISTMGALDEKIMTMSDCN